ncbi:MAG TPA: type III-A CRISPR-associated RAMP protein Csm3 [Blastocatellia bacterium]|nr:type III-A CRISPR-associated RAMP protein Csm3 [Blastocatellia bacterium]
MSEFNGNVLIYGKVECLTGLHIGGTGGGYEIGGMDNPIIRNAMDGFPYIPGSSLKGKMRALTEWAEGKVTDGKVYQGAGNEPDDSLCLLFGRAADRSLAVGPTRLTVRDAFVDEETMRRLKELEDTQGLPKVEIKTEVNINRITSKPLSGPRQMERVPVGSKFNFALLYSSYRVNGLSVTDEALLTMLFRALRLVEDSALGGSGSRGSGQVRFHLAEPVIRTRSDYESGTLAALDFEQATQSLAAFNAEKIQALAAQLQS